MAGRRGGRKREAVSGRGSGWMEEKDLEERRGEWKREGVDVRKGSSSLHIYQVNIACRTFLIVVFKYLDNFLN